VSLQREAATKAIHKVEAIEVWRVEPAFLDALEPHIGRRNVKLELLRNDGQLYVTVGGSLDDGGRNDSTLTRGITSTTSATSL
jgi:hypothetical protein